MDLEPGPFATRTPWPPLPPLSAPTAFVTLGAPALATLESANAAIRAAHSAIAPFVTSDLAQAFTTEIAPAAAALDAFPPSSDESEVGAILEALDGVVADLAEQGLDLPGPDDEDEPAPPDPGPPPGWDKDVLPTPAPTPLPDEPPPPPEPPPMEFPTPGPIGPTEEPPAAEPPPAPESPPPAPPHEPIEPEPGDRQV